MWSKLQVRYVRLPAEEVDTQLLQDTARKEAESNRANQWKKQTRDEFTVLPCFTLVNIVTLD